MVQLQEALASGVKLAVNQLCYNIIFRAAEFEIIPFCKANGIAIMGYSPLMQGLLTGRWKSADEVPSFRARTRHFAGTRPKSRHGEAGHESLLFSTLARIQAIADRECLSMVDLALMWPLGTLCSSLQRYCAYYTVYYMFTPHLLISGMPRNVHSDCRRNNGGTGPTPHILHYEYSSCCCSSFRNLKHLFWCFFFSLIFEILLF